MAYIKHPELLEWLKGCNVNCLLRSGVSFSYLRLIGYGHKQPSARVASVIERLTQGRVCRKELRPNDWQEIWPELTDKQLTQCH